MTALPTRTGRADPNPGRDVGRPARLRAAGWQALTERFPVTLLLGLQYGVLAVYPALVHDTALKGRLVDVVGLAVGIAFLVELVALMVPYQPARRPSIVTPSAAAVVLAVGAVAQLGLAFAGNTGYAAQVAGESANRIASLFTPFATWLLFGAVMLMWLYRHERLRRRQLLTGIGAVLAVLAVCAYRTAFIDTLAETVLALLVIAVMMRIVRLRLVVALFLVAGILLPVLYDIKTDIRVHSLAPQGVATRSTITSRLREDLNFAQMDQLPEVPIGIGQPGVTTLLSYGVLPRFLDSGRGSLNAASDLSVALGDQSTTASTLTGLGEAYALGGGWAGVAAMATFTAVAMAVVVRRRSPWGYAAVGLIVTDAIWIEASYPDGLAAVLQGLVSLGVCAVLVALLRRTSRT
jgi:hypothetical protein